MLTWFWLCKIAAFSSLAVFWRWETSRRSATGLLLASSNASRTSVLSAQAIGSIQRKGHVAGVLIAQLRYTALISLGHNQQHPFHSLPWYKMPSTFENANTLDLQVSSVCTHSGIIDVHLLQGKSRCYALSKKLTAAVGQVYEYLPTKTKKIPSSSRNCGSSSPLGAKYSWANSSASSILRSLISSISLCCWRWNDSSSWTSRICSQFENQACG